MKNTLTVLTSQGTLIVENCLEKVQFFCSYDAFPAYDLIGQRNEHDDDRFQLELLQAMNSAMRARSSRKAWEPLLDKSLPVLGAIPTKVDLIESSDIEYAAVRESLHAYYLFTSQLSGITDMAASKMLFLKRPRLAAISDSYMRTAFWIAEPNLQQFPWKAQYCAERALRVSDMSRCVGLANQTFLEWLQQEVAPIVISKSRLIDILVWVDMAIRNGHLMWTKAAITHSWRVASM